MFWNANSIENYRLFDMIDSNIKPSKYRIDERLNNFMSTNDQKVV